MFKTSKQLLALGLAVFLITAAVFSLSTSASTVMTPYLQAVTANSIYVLVECDSTSTAYVDFGTTTAYGSTASTESYEATTASPVTYVHNIKLTGLTANTLYHYRVRHGSNTSTDYTFTTAVNPGTNFRFAYMADCRTGTSIHDTIATRIKNANPKFSLYGGDLCYDSTYSKFKSEFFRTNELSLIANVPFFNAVGNHETWGTNTKAFTHAPASASGTQDYYSFDYGDMHVLVLNTQISYTSGSAQYNFAQSDLANSTKPWKIVIAHKPAYCSGGHGEDSGMKAMTTNIFEPYGVDMVIAGHSHFYQHNLVNGIHHMILGGGGASLVAPSNASYTLKSVQDYNYSIIDMTPTSMHMVVYEDGGTVIDTIDLSTGGSVSGSTVEKRVSTGMDDVEENTSDGSMYTNSTDLELITDGTTNQVVGMRFNGISIPRGAVITNAYLQFTCDEVSSGTANLTIKGEASDNAGAFTTTAYNVSSRAKTSATVTWAPPAWNTIGAAGTNERTPDIKNIIQEIVNRSGWSSGNSIVMQITGTSGSWRCAEAYEGSSTQAPLLHIEYTN
ncbi:MAG: metallophosphoesterase family protein [Clostridia bacterium]|nr:metallophosphoesterase family protein [Clostridia bacterium]